MGEGRLYVCGTPIGNLEDVTDRLRRVLGDVDVVYAEDTRRAAKLLGRLGIDVQVRSLFAGNEKERSAELVRRLSEGEDVAYVSDAGMPAISDPGAWLVREARTAGHPVTVIPGPSAVTTALLLSGFDSDRFVFEGFLPRKGREREDRLGSIAADQRPTVLFVSPHRFAEDIADLRAVVGDHRVVAVTRELTKLHEEAWVGPIAEVAERFPEPVRGEFTLVVSGRPAEAPDTADAIAEARRLVREGMSPSDAARSVAGDRGVSRRLVYQALIDQD
ncbi:MAG TPA: 16S rRNA (cytidine(1402)-2'-O)-methyltransferase [Acidimicrobiia bacterium]